MSAKWRIDTSTGVPLTQGPREARIAGNLETIRGPGGVYAGRFTVTRRAFVPTVLFVSVTIVALTTLALASPPDPVWIAGLWDDADDDDVIILATCSVAIVERHLVSDSRRDGRIVGLIVSVDDSSASVLTPPANQTRAPPA